MVSIFVAKYEEQEIRIENTWFHGEKLFVNNVLQDEKISIIECNLTGHLISKNGERLHLKVHIFGYFKISCRLFVDDKKLEVIQIK